MRLSRFPGGLRAEVGGVLRRRPVERHVPVAVAADLVAHGVPVVVHDERVGRPVEAVPA